MTLDILRCTLKADIEHYYSKAIMGLEEHLYQVTTLINNMIQTLGDMHQSIADIAENIRSIHTCTEKINRINPEGILEYQFTKCQVKRINQTIEALDQGMDEDLANC